LESWREEVAGKGLPVRGPIAGNYIYYVVEYKIFQLRFSSNFYKQQLYTMVVYKNWRKKATVLIL
jgi:hypothetical protein